MILLKLNQTAMRTKPFIFFSILFLLALNVFSNEIYVNVNLNDDRVESFTSKEKDFLQLWHYDQVLKMDLNEQDRDEYFSMLNQYTYKMSRLGLPQYHNTDAERKFKFDELADKLDASMKKTLSKGNYIIHHESFDQIEHIVYKKRNWYE